MKRLLSLFLLVIPFTLFSQRDSVYIKTSIFDVMYSEKLKEPLWVKYSVKCPEGSASRSGMDFYTNDSVITSTNVDYAHNEYDKGHMAPAADFNCTTEMLYQTFTYLNCALQNQYLNRGVWRLLEAYERELAKVDSVNVKIIVVFDKNSVVLPSGAHVPSGFYKIITLTKANKIIKYYFPNEKPTKKTFDEYKIN